MSHGSGGMHDHDSVEKLRLRVLVHHLVKHFFRHAEQPQPVRQIRRPQVKRWGAMRRHDHVPSPSWLGPAKRTGAASRSRQGIVTPVARGFQCESAFDAPRPFRFNT